jgi:stress response protein YsnF
VPRFEAHDPGTAIAAFGVRPDPVMSDSAADPSNASATAAQHSVLPVFAEELALGVDDKVVGALRVRIEVEASPQQLPGEECVEQALVQRVPRGVAVAAARPPWSEGDTLVVPVYAERVEVRRTLVLTEEIRIARHALRRAVSTEAVARRERAVVERRQPDGSWREVEVPSAPAHDMTGRSHPHPTERTEP